MSSLFQNAQPFLSSLRRSAGLAPLRRSRIRRSLSQRPSTAVTASVLAPLLYRASPLDPTFRLPPARQSSNLPTSNTAPSTDTEGSLPTYDRAQQHHQTANINATTNPGSSSIPSLSALASVASAPSPHLRYKMILLFRMTLLETRFCAGCTKLKHMRNCTR